MIHIEYLMLLSLVMLFVGIFGFFTQRSTLAMLISIELMLNAADLNFAAFNRIIYDNNQEGYFFTLFSIAITAAETAIAIAIIINLYRTLRNTDVKHLGELKW